MKTQTMLYEILATCEKRSRQELAKILDCHVDHVTRLVKELQAKGIPIQIDMNKRERIYYLLPEDREASLSLVRLSSDEKFALMLAVSVMEKTMSEANLVACLKRIRRNVQQQYQAPHERNIFGFGDTSADEFEEEWNDTFVFPAPEDEHISPQVFETLRTAIQEQKRVQLTYHSNHKDETTTRLFSPLRIVIGSWILQGWCHKSKAFRDLKMSRISEIQLINALAKWEKLDELKANQAQRFGLLDGGKLEKCRLSFVAEMRPYFKKKYHPTQHVSEIEDGRFIVTFETNSLESVRAWVLSWGNKVVVLSPLSLVQKIEAEIVSLAESYGLK